MPALYAAEQPGVHPLFCDEAWWGLRAEVGRVWARGPRPVLRVSSGRSRAPVMAAAEPATGTSVAIIAGRFDHRWFGHFPREVSREYEGERVVLVVDRAGWHVARKLEAPDNAILWFLPPHSPETNPIERVWEWLRSHHTRGKLSTRLDDPLDTLSSALKELMDDPERVRSLTGRTWLYAK